MPAKPGRARSRASWAAASSGRSSGTQATTPAISGCAAAISSIASVSAVLSSAWTRTARSTPAAAARPRKSSKPNVRLMAAFSGRCNHS